MSIAQRLAYLIANNFIISSVQKGSVQWYSVGNTISVALFIAAMNLLLRAGDAQCKGPKVNDGTRHFQLDPEKLRSPCILKVKIKKEHLTSQQSKRKESDYLEVSTTASSRTVITLWVPKPNLIFGLSQSTTASSLEGLRYSVFSIELYFNCSGPSHFPMSQVDGMGSLHSKYLRRSLGVSPSLSPSNLYSKTRKLSLPVASVAKKFKAVKARAVSTPLSSMHGKMRHAKKG